MILILLLYNYCFIILKLILQYPHCHTHYTLISIDYFRIASSVFKVKKQCRLVLSGKIQLKVPIICV